MRYYMKLSEISSSDLPIFLIDCFLVKIENSVKYQVLYFLIRLLSCEARLNLESKISLQSLVPSKERPGLLANIMHLTIIVRVIQHVTPY